MALGWSYWLLLAGVIIMVSDLSVAGLVEARIWKSGAPWMESVRAAVPYWAIRTLSFVPIAAGFFMLFCGLITGDKGAGLKEIENTIGLEPVREVEPRLVRVSSAEAG
jgi:cbb3-type cytochrome oxidase subunit 1